TSRTRAATARTGPITSLPGMCFMRAGSSCAAGVPCIQSKQATAFFARRAGRLVSGSDVTLSCCTTAGAALPVECRSEGAQLGAMTAVVDRKQQLVDLGGQ